MANRFPLVVDTDDGNRLKEIPSGDSLDFSSVGIANLTSLSVSGSLSSSTMATTGNVSVGGTLNVTGASTISTLTATTMTATSLTLNGNAVVPQIQSDWTETNTGSAAFILNKPVLNQIDNLNDIGDVFVSDAILNDVLTYDGTSWQASPAAGGVQLSDFSVVTNPASGQGSLIYNAAGVFTFTPANALTAGSNISLLTNDSEFTTIAEINTNNYLQQGDVIGSGRITATAASGQVTLTFDATGLLTLETDTLATVTSRGATTTTALEADAFNQAPTSTSTNTLKDVSIETLDILTSITSTSSNFSTGGNISATTGTVTGNTVTASSTLNAPTVAGVGSITNTATISVDPGSNNALKIESGRLELPAITLPPTSPLAGQIFYDGGAFYGYVGDNGSGSAGALTFPAFYSTLGLQLPAFENADLPSAAEGSNEGMIAWDLTNSSVVVFNGTSWANV
jgi:hypothetical protein